MNTMTTDELTIAIAVPLEAEHVERIRAVDPSITVLYEPELLPPERFPADHSGDPDFKRTPEQEERYWSMLGRAQILYGFPNENPAGLARIAQSNPHLQWIHAMAAGAGGAVKASGLDSETLQKFKVTTSAGRARPSAGRVRSPGHPQRLQAQRGTCTGPGRQGLARAAHPDQTCERNPKLVITGLGEIGLETARIARALGMRVSGTKRNVEAIEGIDEVAGQFGPRRACWLMPTPSSTPSPAPPTRRSSSTGRSSPR